MGSTAQADVVRRVLRQADSCGALGSPLYEMLLRRVAEDVRAGGPAWRVLEVTADDPSGSARALRFMGAVHRLVLEGAAPELARHYPSVGGRVGDDAADVLIRTVERHEERLRLLVREPVQTNEVGRSAALVGGFLEVARASGLPLSVLEVGASAGLNLRWDRYRYEARGATWGDPDSPVRLCSFNSERPPPFDVDCTVVDRRGCDRAPVHATTEEGRSKLVSYVWADQLQRLRLLRSALQVAQQVPVEVDPEPAGTWVRDRLAEDRGEVATVVFHSIVMPYLAPDEREELEAAVRAAGRRATPEAPLAWLRMEPAGPQAEVHLTQWPGGRDRLVATAGYHGGTVRWLL